MYKAFSFVVLPLAQLVQVWRLALRLPNWTILLLVMACLPEQLLAEESLRAKLQLPEAGADKVSASLDAFLNARSIKVTRSANDLGWDCMAATELAKLKEQRAEARVRAIANKLARDLVSSATGRPQGWGQASNDKRCPSGGYDAFGDGTCNPSGTVYAFQTGLGIACLARASHALNDPALMKTARDVFASWQPLMMKGPCHECIYFPISNSPNDANRYVRNMNVFMAFGAATIGTLTGDRDILKTARHTMASELAEHGQGNRGYLGILDRQWIKSKAESDRIENHAASVALISQQIGALLDSEEYVSYSRAAWRTWATCDNERCRKSECKYWAADPARCQATQTATHCAFRSADKSADEMCRSYLAKVPAVGSFGLWSVLVAPSAAPPAAPSATPPAVPARGEAVRKPLKPTTRSREK